jgi:hypothetical protein
MKRRISELAPHTIDEIIDAPDLRLGMKSHNPKMANLPDSMITRLNTTIEAQESHNGYSGKENIMKNFRH